jgi:hypothetical protein
MATIYTRAIKGSALTWTEGDANITNLNNDKIEDIVEDTTPQLGGNLDTNGNKVFGGSYGGNTIELPVGFGPVITNGYEDAITLQSSSNNTTFKQWKFKNDGTTQFPAFTFPATDGTADYVLKTNGSGTLSWVAQSTPGISDVVADTTPQLGGDLDINGSKIVSTSNGNIALEPNGTGKVTANKNIETTADIKAKEIWSTNSSGDEGGQISLAQAATNSTLGGDTVTIDIWQNRLRIFEQGGDARGVYIDLTAAASGVATNLLSGGGSSFVPASPGEIGATTPDVGNFTNVNVKAGNELRLADSDSSNYVGFKSPTTVSTNKVWTLPDSDGTNGQVLKTDGGANLSWTTVSSFVPASPGEIGASSPDAGNFTNVNVKAGNDLRLYEGDNSNYVGFKAPTGVSANKVWLLPAADGTANQVLKTDGAGNLGWATAGGGGIASVSADTAPTLGGNLDVNNYFISNQNDLSLPVQIKTTTLNLGATTGAGSTGNTLITTLGASSIQIGPQELIYSYMTIAKNANGAITFVTDGTGNINLSPTSGKTVAKNLNYNEGTIYDLGTTGGTIAPNVTNGNVQKITLNSALTLNAFTSPVAGQSLTLIIYGGTAYTSITSTMKFAGGIKTLTATAGCIDILSVYYDGTNYFASLGKGFA